LSDHTITEPGSVDAPAEKRARKPRVSKPVTGAEGGAEHGAPAQPNLPLNPAPAQADAPRAAEIVVAVVVTDSGRPLPRIGGLQAHEIQGTDGLR
jgi:hypothetical protein